MVAERALTRQGYEVTSAHDGEEGLELVRDGGEFDLVVSDVVMPAMDGPAMAREIRTPLEAEGGSILMTFSRRTPEAAKDALTISLGGLPGLIWDGEGANPYFAFLAAADYILVTEDSTNMATEAASTGKPVFILKMEGQSPKFRQFHETLERHGAARPFGGGFHRWTYAPLQETERAAKEIWRRYDAWRTR